MAIVITSANDDIIAMPAWLMKALNLHDGATVKATIEGQSLNLSPLNEFLALRGVLRDDDPFEEAINSLNGQWDEWTQNLSA